MIGTNVRDQQGERVGSIEDIVLDRDGNVSYAVISAGGFLGMGENLYAVPWESLAMQPGEDHYVMNVDKERMKAAHGFDKDNWPDMADTKWDASNRGFYSTTPGTTAPAAGTAAPPAAQQPPPAATSPATGQPPRPAGQTQRP
jgi:hypothetical protein